MTEANNPEAPSSLWERVKEWWRPSSIKVEQVQRDPEDALFDGIRKDLERARERERARLRRSRIRAVAYKIMTDSLTDSRRVFPLTAKQAVLQAENVVDDIDKEIGEPEDHEITLH